MRTLGPLLLVVALCAAGCPSSETNGGASTKTPPSPPPATEPAPPPPPQPSGPTGPSPRATPDPDDGLHQLDLLETRPIQVAGVKVTAWLADTDPRRQLGLMHVRELPPDHGMLFIYPDVRPRSFWMKNTLIPLSIAYIDEKGRIDSIVDMEPLQLRTYPSRGSVRFALEMTQHWFAAHGIREGAQVDGIVNLPGYE